MTTETLALLSDVRCFGGRQLQYQHPSSSTQCSMRFSIYLPPQAEQGKVPVLYWLSGLTCTDENFVQKAGAQRYAAELGFAVVVPDTSPRGDQVADDPDGAYDFGLGAGFYVNATQAPWKAHYRMYDYVVSELTELVSQHFPVDANRAGIFGHSMGGHGALTLGLRNPDRFKSISAFAPIVAPTQCPWGQKALRGYFGDNLEAWKQSDACELLRHMEGPPQPLLIDQGSADQFLQEQLKPQLLEQVCQQRGFDLTLNLHEGYDHSYFFIASLIEQHFQFHAQHLNA